MTNLVVSVSLKSENASSLLVSEVIAFSIDLFVFGDASGSSIQGDFCGHLWKLVKPELPRAELMSATSRRS